MTQYTHRINESHSRLLECTMAAPNAIWRPYSVVFF